MPERTIAEARQVLQELAPQLNPEMWRRCTEELQQAEHHANAGGTEAVFPAKGLAKIAADEGSEQRAQVDAGVEK